MSSPESDKFLSRRPRRRKPRVYDVERNWFRKPEVIERVRNEDGTATQPYWSTIG